MKKNMEIMGKKIQKMSKTKGKWDKKTSRVVWSLFLLYLGVLVGLLV
jgi:hypothetical protein